MGTGICRARLILDEAHLSEIVSALEKRQGLLAYTRDGFADHDGAVGDDVHLLTRLSLAKNKGPGFEMLLAGQRAEEVDLHLGEFLLPEQAQSMGHVEVPFQYRPGG
jgi:hypothetical protein